MNSPFVASERLSRCPCGWVANFESLVEGFEDAVEVPVSLSLLGVPIDGIGVGICSVTESDRREVVDIKESTANAGK